MSTNKVLTSSKLRDYRDACVSDYDCHDGEVCNKTAHVCTYLRDYNGPCEQQSQCLESDMQVCAFEDEQHHQWPKRCRCKANWKRNEETRRCVQPVRTCTQDADCGSAHLCIEARCVLFATRHDTASMWLPVLVPCSILLVGSCLFLIWVACRIKRYVHDY